MKATIEQIESYSCETYGVTMEQLEDKGTRQPSIVNCRRMIIYLLLEYRIVPVSEIATKYKMLNQAVKAAYWYMYKKREDDIELNSVITEFEKEYIN